MTPKFVVVFNAEARDALLEECMLVAADIKNGTYTFLLAEDTQIKAIPDGCKYIITNQLCL